MQTATEQCLYHTLINTNSAHISSNTDSTVLFFLSGQSGLTFARENMIPF